MESDLVKNFEDPYLKERLLLPPQLFHLPVSISDPLELLAQETSQEMSYSTSLDQGFSNGP